MSDDAHQFDRRKDDVNVASLANRVGMLEGRVEVIEHEMRESNAGLRAANAEIRANTRLTEEAHGWSSDVHQAVFGIEGRPGMSDRVDEMYEIFAAAREGLRLIGKAGRGAIKAAEVGGRLAKPLFWVAALGAASWAWWKTGSFTLPDWTVLK